jgi:cytochrome c biogenesis protein CcmG/thiol:disulfide interchange protein DsbE
MKLFVRSLIALVLFTSCSSSSASEREWPGVAIQNIDGVTIDSSTVFRGNTTVISLWSTTCVPCRVELPQLQEFAAAHAEIDVIAVNLGDVPDSVQKYAAEIGLTMPVIIDFEGRVSTALGITSVPSTLVLSPAGKVIGAHLGEITAGELALLVDTSN